MWDKGPDWTHRTSTSAPWPSVSSWTDIPKPPTKVKIKESLAEAHGSTGVALWFPGVKTGWFLPKFPRPTSNQSIPQHCHCSHPQVHQDCPQHIQLKCLAFPLKKSLTSLLRAKSSSGNRHLCHLPSVPVSETSNTSILVTIQCVLCTPSWRRTLL